MQRHATRRRQLLLAVDLLHVAAHLGDKHPPVAIEHGDDRFLDLRLGHDQFEAVAGRELEGLEFVLRALRLHGRHGRKFLRLRRRRVRGEKAGAERGEDEGGNAGACYHGMFGTDGWAGEVFVLIFLRQEGEIRKAKRQKGRRGGRAGRLARASGNPRGPAGWREAQGQEEKEEGRRRLSRASGVFAQVVGLSAGWEVSLPSCHFRGGKGGTSGRCDAPGRRGPRRPASRGRVRRCFG